MFNDVGVIATAAPSPDGTREAGFRVFVAGGLGANPHPALALEEFTSRDDLMATLEAILRVFSNHGNRDNKLRARMKWLVDTMGWDELQARMLKERKFLVGVLHLAWRHPRGRPEVRRRPGRARRSASSPTPIGQGTPVTLRRDDPYKAWDDANVVRGVGQGHGVGHRLRPARRHHHGAVPGTRVDPAGAGRRRCASPTARTSSSAASARASCPVLHQRLSAIGMAEPGAELARDVVACPGADTCNLAVTQSRGLADAIGAALDEAGLADVGGIRTNISGCTNSCGQHHISDIGFFGAERRAHGQSAPGYQLLLGGYVGQEKIHFGEKALRLPAKNAPEAAVRVVRRFNDERQAGEAFRSWMDRAGGVTAIADEPARPRRVSPTPRTAPTSTSTTTRPAPTSPRPASRSAQRERRRNCRASRDDELAELNREFERLPASKIIQWAVDSFAPHLSLSASMNDAVLIDLATKVHPGIEVVFIDTGYHFPETLETVETVRRRYGLNLRMMTVPHHDEELWKLDPENCCSAVKVGQLDRALEGKAGVDERSAPRGGGDPWSGTDRGPRPARPRQGQPARHLDHRRRRGLHRRPRRAR